MQEMLFMMSVLFIRESAHSIYLLLSPKINEQDAIVMKKENTFTWKTLSADYRSDALWRHEMSTYMRTADRGCQ